MKKSMVRTALCSSVSLIAPAVSAAMLIPTAAAAATVCTGANDIPNNEVDITCIEGGTTVVAIGTSELSTNVLVPLQGLSALSFTTMTVTLTPGSATNNTITTTLASTPGILLTSSGALTLDAPNVNVTSTGPSTNAVQLSSTGTVTVNTGVLTVQNFDSDALHITGGAGAINATIAGASATGTNTRAVNITSTSGPITFTNTGPITGGGIRTTSTSGDQTINVNSAVNVNFTTAILTSSDTGNQIINIGANVSKAGLFGDAVRAGSTGGGTLTVNVTGGNVTASGGFANTDHAIALSSSGGKIVNISAGRTVSGAGGGDIFGGGGSTLTVNNSGTVGTSASHLAVSTDATTAAAINNLAGGVLNGNVTLSGLADTLSNSGTWNTQGTSDFGAGADVLANTSTGTINLTGATTLANLETFTNAGRINLNTFTLTGPAIAFTNTGTIATSGSASLAGFTTLSNSGTLDLAAGTFTVPAAVFTNTGTILADEGATTITGQTNFANSATIDLQDGVPDDVLTINSSFVGSGGSNLLVDYSGTAVDRLVITGAASGTTLVNVTPTANMVINPTGLLMVDTGTSTADAFVLGTTSAGLIDLRLIQNGADYFLSSVPNVAAVEPVVVGDMATNLWYQSADIYSNYAALRRSDLGVNRTSNWGFWGQAYYAQDKDDDQDVSVFGVDFAVDRVKTKRYGFQAGLDYLMGNSAVLGITGGYERAKADVRNSAADFKAEGWNAGAYAMFGGASGFYGDFLVKYDRANLEFGSPLFATMTDDPDITSSGARGQAGYRFGSGSMSFDLGAGLAYVTSKIDDFAVGAIDFDFDRVHSLRGDLSARATFGTGAFAPFIEGRLFHEFGKDRDLTLVSGTAVNTINGEGRGTWGRLEAGIGAQNSSGPILAAWGDFGDLTGWGVKAGWRFGGSQVEAAPPSPPPPPPPPAQPATQTCPDGSVILATSICPAPPPPPPPPPVERGERGE